MNRRARAAPLAFLATATLVLTGCASAPEPEMSGPISVVTSTNVYGDIAGQIGGDRITVTSIIDNPDRDPHEFEVSGQNQLSLAKANIAIENGGGYDDFMTTMLDALNNNKATVLDVADISGYDQDPSDGEFNEHLWYDFPTMHALAVKLAAVLSAADAPGAATYKANAVAFNESLLKLERAEGEIKDAHSGAGVVITEPVPLYMLEASGFNNLTPADFSKAIEDDSDVAPSVMHATTALFSSGEADVLVYNTQTTGPQTTTVINAAKKHDVPMVGVSETLPRGEHYLKWMTHNLNVIADALAQ